MPNQAVHIEVGGRVVIVLQDVVISAEITGVRCRENAAHSDPCCEDETPKEQCCDDVPSGPTVCIETTGTVSTERCGWRNR